MSAPTRGRFGTALARLVERNPQRPVGQAAREWRAVPRVILSDRWLGRAEPGQSPANRSLAKYKLIIDDFGGWNLFQELLQVLRRIADRRGCDIATVASRAMLARPAVAAVIVGATVISHLADNCRIGSIDFDDEDADAIEAVTRRRTGPTGDVYTLERDRNGRHGRIMKYDLNK
jgi:aryl-alcohol dehydrogenase-like predicted oxidoreductase